MDTRIYDRKKNVGKRSNKKEKYISVVSRGYWEITTMFTNELDKSKSTIK